MDLINGETREAINARRRRNYAKDPARWLAKAKAWREQNRDRFRKLAKGWPSQSAENKAAIFKAYYAANADKRREASRKWYEATKDAVNARRRSRREANKEAINAAKRATWPDRYSQKAEHYLEACARRRAMKRAQSVGRIDYVGVRLGFSGLCGICRKPLDINSEPYHYDHIIPLASGGAHATSNIQIAHARCNWSKGGRVA